MRTNRPDGSHSSTSIEPVVALSISEAKFPSSLLRLLPLLERNEVLPPPLGEGMFSLKIKISWISFFCGLGDVAW